MRSSVSRGWVSQRRPVTWAPQRASNTPTRQKIDFAAFQTAPSGFRTLDDFLADFIDLETEEELKPVRIEFAEGITERNLTKLRLSKGLNQKQLADTVGTSQPRLSNWECGSESPGLDNIRKLSEALDVDYNTLCEALINAKR